MAPLATAARLEEANRLARRSSMSTLIAAGVLPRPGIVCMSPQSATIQPAPV